MQTDSPLPSAPTLDPLSLTLAALADPTRRAMLRRLAEGEASVTELGAPFALSQPAISKHIKVLERAGLVSRSRSAQFRPVRLQEAPLRQMEGWMADLRQIAGAQMDRLALYLDQLQQATPPPETPEPTLERITPIFSRLG